MNTSIIDQIKAARRVSVPLVVINTPDSGATIDAVCAAVNGKHPKLAWDYIRGMMPLNESGTEWVATLGEQDPTISNPVEALVSANKLPAESILFIHLANRWIVDPAVIQAAWNLRDSFKQNRRLCVLLGKHVELPTELSDDVVVLDEPLPTEEQLSAIVLQQHENASLKTDATTTTAAVEALRGLSAFSAEQITAMSLTKDGLQVDSLWEKKRQTIEQTPGLKVFRGGDNFDSIGGLSQVKRYMVDLLTGRSKPNALVWLDEAEKAMPGGTNDLSGVSQDQLGTILSYMEDEGVLGVMLVGVSGSGKSAIAKAAGNCVSIPTIRLDLGACTGSLVGESQQKIRNALKIISAVSNNKPIFVATANSIDRLDSALKRRFPFIFCFDLPTREEKDAIWKIWLRRLELNDVPATNDEGWSGANIQKCCECAWRLNRTVEECRKYIVPCAKVAAREIESLRKQADGVFLSASDDGPYQAAKKTTAVAKRNISIEE